MARCHGLSRCEGFLLISVYTLVTFYSNRISPFLIGNTSSKGPFSIAMLDYQSVVVKIRKKWDVEAEFQKRRHVESDIIFGRGNILNPMVF